MSLRRALLALAIAGTLLLLLGHALHYRFLTDDAYISFRYADNLADGHGLVFNPGGEAVEGYTNFLWVLLLAGLSALRLPPPVAAQVLGLGATCVLWLLLLGYARRHLPPPGQRWLLLLPLLWLGATRSVAVWSTSGLETRLFEVLVLGGLLRAAAELRALLAGGRPRPLAGLLLGLGALTRPDGIIWAGGAGLVVLGVLLQRRRLAWRHLLWSAGTIVVLVGGHLLLRWWIYGELWPNTARVKIYPGGWIDMGLTYLGAFLLEYGALFWVPLLVLGVRAHWRRGEGWLPLLLLGPLGLYLSYLVYVGGDHFEYRPLDLVFPIVMLLMYDGARALATSVRGQLACAGLAAMVLVGLVTLPLLSHLQFPPDAPPGFPGSDKAGTYLQPGRTPGLALPGLRWVAQAHRDRLRQMTRHFVGIRQEEHEEFLRRVLGEANRLRRLVQLGLLSPETHLAVDCVGAIPYLSQLPTMDRLGLTDADVARGAFARPSGARLMAHDKRATLALARRKGVDLWALHPFVFTVRKDDPAAALLLMAEQVLGQPVHAASLGGGWFLAAVLPRGAAQVQRRLPRLHLFRVADATQLARALKLADQRPDPFAGLDLAARLR